MQFYLTYNLGLRPTDANGWRHPKPGFKADKGNLVHKALELLASKKLALQEGRSQFANEETGGTYDTVAFTADDAFEAAWAHYTAALPHWEWGPKDYRDCRKWTFDAMAYNNGLFNPLKRHVIWPEKRFDFVIDQPWARYAYTLPDGRKLEGQLGIKGTVDLVCTVDEEPDIVEYLDWKTGERKDWATGKPKDYRKLRDDPQLRLYHYALSRLCPQAREIIVTIVYIRSGGPFSLPFGPEDLPKTEEMLRKRFEVIKECSRPRLIKGDPAHRWKCQRLCVFEQNNWEDTGKTVCEHIKDELLTLGMDRVTAKYGDPNTLTKYGDGGGKTAC